LFNFAAIVSATLALNVALLWVRTAFRADEVRWLKREVVGADVTQRQLDVRTDRGQTEIIWTAEDAHFTSVASSLVAHLHSVSEWDHIVKPYDPTVGVWRYVPRLNQMPHTQRTSAGFNVPGASYGTYLTTISDPSVSSRSTMRIASFPHWTPIILFLILPAIRLNQILRRRRRIRRGQCVECGYDLRASSDRCPECGDNGRRAR
jgi:hypothetical protein